ncbi:hypothetical protein AB1286_26900 [Trinickia sp. NRRL B-1857]|uniref:hypothetical protein n=1 Tax=Trinickia sp. NRRL B-1857 TaxID=3162879 RepID=UPI003D2A57D8
MQSLSIEGAQDYLRKIGMKIGAWNEICYIETLQSEEPAWIRCRAPKDARELYVFSQYVAGWLPGGSWKIFQVDNSTSLSVDESYLFCRLVGIENYIEFSEGMPCRTFLLESADGFDLDLSFNLMMANIIYIFLLFEGHGHLVSSGSRSGEKIGVQDGFVYFSSGREGLSRAKQSMADFESNPLMLPEWVRLT